MHDIWPFADPENAASITLRQIVDQGQPVSYVSHDSEDGCWQFLTGANVGFEDAMVILLRNMVDRDPSLAELADLPLGWQATRESVGSAWVRSARAKMHPEEQ